MEEFLLQTRIVSGPGSVEKLKELEIKRLLVVSDPFFEKNGTARHLAELSGAQHIRIYSGVQPDPTVRQVAEGTAVVQQLQPDTVVALGGGSAMDCAKAMVWFSGVKARFIAIPTTSGSGSEVTDFAVLTHEGIKHPLVDRRLQPDMAILDSDLLKQLPKSLIADGGFDVLAHAAESFVATGAGPVTDALAMTAFSQACTALPQSFKGSMKARQQMHGAATLAGMAFTQSGLGLCHAMAHCLGGMFHLPHGRLCAILLPAVIGVNNHPKYKELACASGFGGSSGTMAVRSLKNGLTQLRRSLSMPGTLSEAGIEPGKVWSAAQKIVESTLSDPCCQTNPVKVEDYMIRRVLEEVTGRD